MKSVLHPICQTAHRLGLLTPSEATTLWIPAVWTILFISLIFYLHHSTKSKLLLLASLPALLITNFMLYLVTSIIFEGLGNPVSSTYFSLNAAVKNTCLIDPLRRNCPTNLEELVKIEPENFSRLLQGKFAVYQYFPDSSQYFLAIKHDRWRGVIFDPRLTQAGSYDFIDVRFNPCGPPASVKPLYSENPWKSVWVKYNQVVDLKSLLK